MVLQLRPVSHAVTDVGAVRELNEDRYFASDRDGVWAVADGMGGMARGDWAATQVVDALGAGDFSSGLEQAMAAAGRAFEQANAHIFEEAGRQGTQMGTTTVLLAIRDRQFAVLWVGDSRAYLWRDHRLHRLTRDHSQVQDLIDHGVLTPQDAETHPLRNVITRAIGVDRYVEPDMISDTLQPDDVLLLCSDGLHGVLGEAGMSQLLASSSLEDASRQMIARCHELGAPDNITLVAVVAAEVTALQFGTGADAGK